MNRSDNCGNCYYWHGSKCCRNAPEVLIQPMYTSTSEIVNGTYTTKYHQSGAYPATVWPATTMNDWCADHWSVRTTPPKEVAKARPDKRTRELML